MRITIEQLSPKVAQNLCRKITANLPEYFGLPACNEHYAMGVLDRINFAAKLGNDYVGLLCLDFPYPMAIVLSLISRSKYTGNYGSECIATLS
ncbi:hypothetical protein [Legionella sp. 29fVS95]|uniref:hypothetical protein n=1 Tax=Legionella sp. 29fVS95 TaxID=3402813 RepID=UPI003AF88F02